MTRARLNSRRCGAAASVGHCKPNKPDKRTCAVAGPGADAVANAGAVAGACARARMWLTAPLKPKGCSACATTAPVAPAFAAAAAVASTHTVTSYAAASAAVAPGRHAVSIAVHLRTPISAAPQRRARGCSAELRSTCWNAPSSPRGRCQLTPVTKRAKSVSAACQDHSRAARMIGPGRHCQCQRSSPRSPCATASLYTHAREYQP